MKRSRFTDSQIIAILKRAEAGTSVPELCREHGISSASFYKWRSKFGGMDAVLMSRLKKLEEENRRLKKVYAEERLKSKIIQEVMAKSGEAVRPEADGTACSHLFVRLVRFLSSASAVIATGQPFMLKISRLLTGSSG